MTNQNTRKNKKCSGFNTARREISLSKNSQKHLTAMIFVQARQSPQGILLCISKGFNAAWTEISPSKNKKCRSLKTTCLTGLWDKDMSRGFAFARPIG